MFTITLVEIINTQYMTNLTTVSRSKWNMGEILAFLAPKNDGEKLSRIFFLELLHAQAIFY